MRPARFRIRTLMIAIAVVAFAIGGGLFVAGAREARAQAECRNNLALIGLAVHNYLSGYDVFPPGTVANPALPPSRRLSWMVQIFNFIEQGLGLVVDLGESWDSPANRTPLFRHTSTDGDPPPYTTSAADPALFRCPAHASPRAAGVCPSDYVGIAGLGTDAPTLPTADPRAGVFGYDRQTTVADIKDGTAYTMMIAETAASSGPWIAGGPATIRGLDPARRPYIGPGRQFGGLHHAGAMVAFADGSVRVLSPTIDEKVFEALSTIAGRELVADDMR